MKKTIATIVGSGLLILGAVSLQPEKVITKEFSLDGEKVIVNPEPVQKEVLGGLITRKVFKPDVKLGRFGGETFLRVWSDDEVLPNAIEQDGKIISKSIDGKREYHFYIKKSKRKNFEPIQQTFSTDTKVRYIFQDVVSPLEMAGGYEVFDFVKTDLPVIRTYIPGFNGFVFFGGRKAQRDLRKSSEKLNRILRYKTLFDKECPVILSNFRNGFVIEFFYQFKTKEERIKFLELFNETVNEVLREKGINLFSYKSAFLYQKNLQIFQLGRSSADKNHLILYLYLTKPDLQTIRNEYQPFVKLRDTEIAPLLGLQDINSEINFSIRDEIIKRFASKIGIELIKSDFSKKEQNKILELKDRLFSREWLLNAKRPDFDYKQEKSFFEYEIILNEKPTQNFVEISFNSKNLVFYYQPALTEEEKLNGAYRSEDVIGSYAVYYKPQQKYYKTKEEAKKFKTGKAFHIYRPKIIDRNGNFVYGELKIRNNKLRIEIPQNFLEKAEYPIVVDPTFGKTTQGGSYISIANVIRGTSYEISENGIGESITAYISEQNTASLYKFAIYATSTQIGTSTLVATTTEGTTENLSGWKTLSLTTQPNLLANTRYELVAWGSGKVSLYYDTEEGEDKGRNVARTYATNWPTEIRFNTSNRFYSIYCTYSTGTSTPSQTQQNPFIIIFD